MAGPSQSAPHETTMAVWDVRTPVVVGSTMTVRVGLRCADACRLSGRFVQVFDAADRIVAEARLGSAPLEGTEALYWCDVALKAPPTEGVAQFRAAFVDTVAELGHDSAMLHFSCRVTPAPNHQVTITVVDQHTGARVSDVEVRFGLYIQPTDKHGIVRVAVPAGSYDLSIRKDGFGAPPRLVEVSADTAIRVDGMSGPTMAEVAPRLTAFEGYPWG